MSHVAHPRITSPLNVRAIWLGLLALAAVATVTLVLVFSGEEASQGVSVSQPTPASSGLEASRPDESRVAAAVGAAASQPMTRPDESRTAAAISGD